MKAGIAVLASVVLSTSATAASNQYAVEGVTVGTQLNFDNASYREYKCSPSQQFDGLTWCQKARANKDRRGPYTAAYSLLHARDGSIVYVNRSQEPLSVSRSEADAEIQRYARSIGEAPRIIKMPQRGAARNGMIAVWGNLALEQLDPESIRTLADGRSPKKGLLIDFLGNFARSAKEGLPIYRIGRGSGFLWAATFDQKGRGTLRTVAVDTSGLIVTPSQQEPIGESAAEETEPQPKPAEPAGTIVEQQDELAIANSRIAELEQARGEADTARVAAEKARVDAEIAGRELEQAKAAEIAALKTTIAQLTAAGPAGDAKGSRWERLLFGSAGGLFGALAAFAIGFLVNRQRARNSKQQSSELPFAPVETSLQCQSEEAEVVSPALSPTIAISETAFESELEAQVVAINAAEEETPVTTDAAASVPESAEKLPAPALV
jgi:hypothetical protein